MFTRAENDAMTLTSPGTPGGRLMRQYWQPVALASDLPANGAPLPLTVMSEELVLFRDEQGRLGLMPINCPHRGADLSYGRVEGGGLRCIYHGWVFDVNGQCLEQPAEPRGKQFCHHVKHVAYPCREAGGMIFAYLGDGAPPLFPEHEVLRAKPEQIHIWKFREQCNYLQGLEGDIDPFHLNFLHKALSSEHARTAPGTVDEFYDFYANGTPRMEIDRMDFGLRIFTIRELSERAYLRVTNYVGPNLAIVAGPTGEDGYTALWHVPVSDSVHIKYMVNYKRSGPINSEMLRKVYELHVIPGTDLQNRRTKENRYLQDREEMKDKWFAGLGPSFSVHDNFVTESMGPIYDRSKERLGYSDMAVVAARRFILAAIADMEAGKEPQGRIHDPQAARMDDIVVRSYIVDDKNNYKAGIQNRPIAAE